MSNSRVIIGEGVSKKGIKYPIYAPVGEVFTEPSLTIPDQSIPLKTLIGRYRRDGTELLKGVYLNDDPSFPDNLDRLDKTDLIDLARGNAAKIASTRFDLDHRTATQKRISEKKAFDDAVIEAAERLKDLK